MGLLRHHPVSPPRSSNRTCGFPASGSPTGFIARHTAEHPTFALTHSFLRRLRIFKGVSRRIANHPTSPSSKACQKSGSFAPPALPDINARMTLSDSHQRPPPDRDVEAVTLVSDGSPPITRITFPTCRAHYPGGSSGCSCRSLPHSRGLPQLAGGSASASALSRPAQASLALRPAGSLSRLMRPLSRGFSSASYPTKPLVSYRIYRHLSGWFLPPLVIRALGAHCQLSPSVNSALSVATVMP